MLLSLRLFDSWSKLFCSFSSRWLLEIRNDALHLLECFVHFVYWWREFLNSSVPFQCCLIVWIIFGRHQVDCLLWLRYLRPCRKLYRRVSVSFFPSVLLSTTLAIQALGVSMLSIFTFFLLNWIEERCIFWVSFKSISSALNVPIFSSTWVLLVCILGGVHVIFLHSPITVLLSQFNSSFSTHRLIFCFLYRFDFLWVWSYSNRHQAIILPRAYCCIFDRQGLVIWLQDHSSRERKIGWEFHRFMLLRRLLFLLAFLALLWAFPSRFTFLGQSGRDQTVSQFH